MAPTSALRATFDEVTAVSSCDMAAQRELLSPDSYDGAWGWSITWRQVDGFAVIERDFSASNGFGVALPHHYWCKVDPTTNRAVELTVFQGYR